MNKITLGDYIANRRRALRLTQQEISERLHSHGIDRSASAIANWETGKQSVPVDILPALASALEISIVLLYAKAGILANLPGAEVVKLMDKLSESERVKITRMIQAYTQENGG